MESNPKQPADVTVLVLGTYHMANPKLDLVKTDIRDSMGADRQLEIQDVNDRIAQFNPTKIAIEAVPPAEKINQAYADFLDGNHVLASDEREQIGFRLGKRCGIGHLDAVDCQMGMDFESLMQSAQKQGKSDFLKFMDETPLKIGKMMEDLDKNHTVGEILAAMNSPAGLWSSHSLYMKFLDVDNDEQFVGSDVVAGWYQRNLRIFSNIMRLATPGDRILVIYGAGHAKHLSDFVSQTPGWKLEDPMKYLPKPPMLAWEL